MNMLAVSGELSKNIKKGLSNPLMFIATFILCVVALNADLSSIRILWWGCVAFFAFSWLLTSELSFVMDTKYTVWIVGFLLFSTSSIFWAHSSIMVITALKSLFIHTFILLLLRSSIHREEDVNRLLIIIACASIINAIYLILTNFEMFTANTNEEIGTRLGTEGEWNANTVGMMAAVATLILVYNFNKNKNILAKVPYLLVIVAMTVVAILSGSRKALFIALMGVSIYLVLVSKKKRLRTILFVIFFVFVVYYSIMKIPFFYSVIGWRVISFVASLTGKGVVDGSTVYRQQLIEAAVDTWKQYPIIGCGLDCFRIYGKIATGRDYYAHNNYVELLADLGVVGAIIYYSGYLLVFKYFFPKLRGNNNLDKLFVTLLGLMIVIDYACVSYSDFLFKLIFLSMFATISIDKKARVESGA